MDCLSGSSSGSNNSSALYFSVSLFAFSSGDNTTAAALLASPLLNKLPKVRRFFAGGCRVEAVLELAALGVELDSLKLEYGLGKARVWIGLSESKDWVKREYGLG